MSAIRQIPRVVNEELITPSLDNLEALESLKSVKAIKRDRLHGELQKCLREIRELKQDIKTKKKHFTQSEQLRESQIQNVLVQATLALTSVEGICTTNYEISQIKLTSVMEQQEIEQTEKQLEQRMNDQLSLSESLQFAEKDLEKAQYLIDTEVNHEQ